MNKRIKTVLAVMCLSLLALAIAVSSLTGSRNGYEMVWEAAEKLLFEEENYTVNTRMRFTFDGDLIEDTSMKAKFDRGDEHVLETDNLTDETQERYEVKGKTYAVDHKEKSYTVYEIYMNSAPMPASDTTILSDTEENRTLARMFRLFADFFSGDVKNQFASEKTEAGRRYTISLSKAQYPEIANLFINLLNAETYAYSYSNVRFEDREAANRVYYKNITGEELDARVMAYYHTDDALEKDYREFLSEVYSHYEKMGQEKYGDSYFVYVDADGNAAVYENERDYYRTLPFNSQVYKEEGPADYIEKLDVPKVRAAFEVDENGRLGLIDLAADIRMIDINGKTHEAKAEIGVSFTDRESTCIEMFDLEGYTKHPLDMTRAEEKKQKTAYARVTFLSKQYWIEYPLENNTEAE